MKPHSRKWIKKVKKEVIRITDHVFILYLKKDSITNIDLIYDVTDFNEYIEGKDEDDCIRKILLKDYYIYAYTFSSFIAKEFLEFRYKDKFFVKVFSCDELGGNIGAIQSSLNDFKIVYADLATSRRIYDDGTKNQYSSYGILLTYSENTFAGMYPDAMDEDVCTRTDFLTGANIACKCMNPKVVDLLGIIGFVEVMRYANWLNTGEGEGFSIMIDEMIVLIKKYYEILSL